jgi:hypothetical protein
MGGISRCAYKSRNLEYKSEISATATIYREIANHMMANGFGREQYSVWHRDLSAAFTWATMTDLREIRPRGIISTVLRRLEMFEVTLPNLFIVTQDVQLGGNLSPRLLGPTPANLAHGPQLGVPPGMWPTGPNDALPFGVRHVFPEAWDHNNWRVSY